MNFFDHDSFHPRSVQPAMFNEPYQTYTQSATLLEVHDPTELLLVELSTRPVVLKPDD